MGHLYHFATRRDAIDSESRRSLQEATHTAAVMRESALKSSIFVGVPRTILSLAELTEALEVDVKESLRTKSQRSATQANVDAMVGRGKELWNSIYEPHADKLYNKLAGYHPDFISFIIQAYGAVLAPLPSYLDQQGNLSRTLGSVVGSACLRAEGRVGPQLISHVFGLLKARNAGVQTEEDAWLSSDEGTEWVITTVDKISDGVASEQGVDQAEVKAKL